MIYVLYYVFIPLLHMSQLMKHWPLMFAKFYQDSVEMCNVAHFHRDLLAVSDTVCTVWVCMSQMTYSFDF